MRRGIQLITTRDNDYVVTRIVETDNNDDQRDRSVETGTFKALTLRLEDIGTEHDFGSRKGVK